MVSVIVTTKNESSHIASCLTSIQRQTYRDTQIIVVDNGSTDKTKEIARTFTPQVYDAGPERSAQRNFGVKKAKGTYVLFLDADMIVTPDVIGECVDAMMKNNYIGVVIPERSFGIGFWAACKRFERRYYEGVDWIEAARFFRKRIIADLGGYDERLTGPEDFELPQRIKERYGQKTIGRISAYINHDEGKLSLAKLLKKKYYYGTKMHRYRTLPDSKGYFQRQANPLTRYALFFRKPIYFLKEPLHGIGMLIMKTLEMFALTWGALRT